ncbi:MAG: dTMP kinase [Eubacterium sp.]|nr:dTMP kinase [Eubacterium sp.]
MKGVFIVLEGPDGSGKSTQIRLLTEYLEQAGREYIVTREPGGTPIGEQIRKLILDENNKEMSDVTEMLLYAASRAQLVKEVIGPAIEEGKVVISDRFVDSSVVYQGIARGLGADTVYSVNDPAIGVYRPDLVIYLDISEDEGIRRKKNQKKLDRLEQESLDFHHMVSEGYRSLLSGREDVERIDGSLDRNEIQEKIRSALFRLTEGNIRE